MISIIIPAKNEMYLAKTIKCLLENATGEIEILPVLDGYEPAELIEDPRVRYLRAVSIGMRKCINTGVAFAKGEYLMKMDAHCAVPKGFDEVLSANCEENWVVIPRRYRLDDKTWSILEGDESVDYEYFLFPGKLDPKALRGYKWRDRTEERKDLLIDDTITFQGSCWFMTKKWWHTAIKNLDDENYGFMGQESTEIAMKTFIAGGRTMINKKIWYAHLRKKVQHGGTHLGFDGRKDCWKYSYNFWVNEHKDEFIKLVEKFWPIPNWPENWKERLWEK